MHYKYSTIMLEICIVTVFIGGSQAFSIRDFIRIGGKRADPGAPTHCPTWHPFECPSGECVPIKYLCDGSPDCSDQYDENKSMCTAATRPPVEETAAFLKALMHAHGGDFLMKIFGPKAKDTLKGMGGVDKVAVALSQSPTADIFASEMKLSEEDMMNMVQTLESILEGTADFIRDHSYNQITRAKSLSGSEALDFRFFAQKLQETGFF